jgi:hypothetical protein
MLAITNAKENILARRIIRLLWDDKNKTPVLFRERTYPRENCPNAYKKDLNEASIALSKYLGIPLVSKNEEGGKPYAGTVQALAGRTPFECVDGLLVNGHGHIVPGDKGYSIPDVQRVD